MNDMEHGNAGLWSVVAGIVSLLFVVPTLCLVFLSLPHMLALAALAGVAYGLSPSGNHDVLAPLAFVALYLLLLFVSVLKWLWDQQSRSSSVTTVLWAVSPAVPLGLLLLWR